MNKSAILAAMLILASSSAYAYENSYAGYSVKDGDPYVRFETNKVYAYSNAQSSDIAKVMQEAAKQAKKKNTNGGFLDKYQGVNSINYYTADEMKEIIGREFSTAYFDAEYENLALLKRSELNLKSVPTPLLDMDKYNLFENKGNIVIQNQLLKENIDKITPVIKLEEIGDKKAISLKYLYKQMNRLINVDLTLISANDRLYVLTNLNQNGTLYAPKAKQAEGKASSKEATKELKKVTLKEVLQQAIKIENIKAEDVPDSVIKTFHK